MINGIDVSHHNTINWGNIRSLNRTQNLYFCFSKASEGLNNPDEKFANNRKGSASAGLLPGAYHFFLPTQDAIAQAGVLSNQVGTLAPGELPPVVDIEWTKIVGKNGQVKRQELWSEVPKAERINVILRFLGEVEQRLGVKPIIYTAVSFWEEFITSVNPPAAFAQFVNYPLWIVNLQGNLTVPAPWGKATFVQNGFGELAPKNATAFQKLDHDFFKGTLFELLTLSTKGLVFAKGESPLSAIVRDFQQVLKAKGFYSDILDGDFGKNTEQAVKDFQQSSGLPVTGIIDEMTRNLLLH